MSQVQCAFCSSSKLKPHLVDLRDLEYGTPWKGSLAKCAECELIQQSPMLTEEQAIALYPDNYVHYHPGTTALRRFLMKRFMGRTIKLLQKHGAKPGMKILDIGCGGGEKLNILVEALGLEATGLEPNKFAVEVCRKNFKWKCIQSTFPHSDIPQNHFDFVRINHVIEHVPLPSQLLVEIHKVLKPGGVLIGETENLDCPSFRVFKKFWSFLHLPYHLLFFTDKTLGNVFKSSPFREVDINYVTDPAAWSLSFQNYTRRNIADLKSQPSRMKGYIFITMLSVPLGWLEALFSKGPVLEFTAKKK